MRGSGYVPLVSSWKLGLSEERTGEWRGFPLVWLTLSVIVAAVGVVFLLEAAGAVNADSVVDHWWPMIVIALAIAVVLSGALRAAARGEIRASVGPGALLAAAGVVLLLFTTHVLKSPWEYVWSALVVLAGVIIASRFLRAILRSTGVAGAGRHGAFRIRSRMLLVRTSDKIGKAIEWLCTGGRPAVLMLVLAAAGFIWWNRWGALLLYVALLLAWSAAKAKTRVVIETFEDHTSSTAASGEARPGGAGDSRDGAGPSDRPDPHRLDASGIAGLLATKLAEMRNVYQLLEEPLERPRPGPAEGAVQLEDIGDVLRSAFTAQSNLTVGPVTLPFGSLMALLGRVIGAPHLRGAIYGSDTQLTLTAYLTMHGRDYVWSVTPPGEAQSPTEARQKMVAELAYRVFTDLSLQGQAAEWPATRYWLDALKERQSCQRTPRERRYHLEAAETHLRNALAEDERFYLAAYNLGIVYRQLAEGDAKRGRVAPTEARNIPDAELREVRDEPFMRSAIMTFKYAIEKLDRGRWEAYYGLALADWKLADQSVGDPGRRLNRVIDDCERALDLAPSRAARAQILDLKATAQKDLGDLAKKLAKKKVTAAEVAVRKASARLGRAKTQEELDKAKTQVAKAENEREKASVALEHAEVTAREQSNAALETWIRACRSILRELTLTQLWRVPTDSQHTTRLRKEAARCLLNLTIAYDAVEPNPTAEPGANLLRRWSVKHRFVSLRYLISAAVRLADLDAEAHEKFADIAYRWEYFDVAQTELQHAIRIEQDNAKYWAMLARASAKKAVAAKTGRDAPEKAQDVAHKAADEAYTTCVRAEATIDFGVLDYADDEHEDDAPPSDPEAAEERNQKRAVELLGEAYDLLDDQQHAFELASRRRHFASRRTLRRELARATRSQPKQSEPRGKQSEPAGARELRLCARLAGLLSDHKDDWEVAIIERHLGQHLLESAAAITKYFESGSSTRSDDEQLSKLLSACNVSDGTTTDAGGAVRLPARALAAAAHKFGEQRRPTKGVEDRLSQAAENVFDDAIKRLNVSEHKADIRRWGLLGEKARAIVRQPDRTGEALPLAERGVAIDPLSASASRALALVREHGGDYLGACTAWNRAQLREPEDAETSVLLALCQWQYARWIVDASTWRSVISEAMANLHAARVLYDVTQMEQRRRAEWWAAKCHWTLGEFAEVPSHLRFILASLERAEPPDEDRALQAAVELMLAQSYRQVRNFAEAEKYALQAIQDADALRRRHDDRRAVPRDYRPAARLRDDEWSLGAIRVLARAELVGCHADRNSARRFDIARSYRAELLANGLSAAHSAEARRDGRPAGQATDPQEAGRVRSELLTERGRAELARGHARKAVRLLKRATRKDPGSAGSYVALARAYQKLAAERHYGEAAVARQKARDSCELARKIVGESHLQWAAAEEIEQALADGMGGRDT